MNRNLVGSTYGRFCIKFPQSRMKGERHRLSPPTEPLVNVATRPYSLLSNCLIFRATEIVEQLPLCRTIELSDSRTIRSSNCRTKELSDHNYALVSIRSISFSNFNFFSKNNFEENGTKVGRIVINIIGNFHFIQKFKMAAKPIILK